MAHELNMHMVTTTKTWLNGRYTFFNTTLHIERKVHTSNSGLAAWRSVIATMATDRLTRIA